MTANRQPPPWFIHALQPRAGIAVASTCRVREAAEPGRSVLTDEFLYFAPPRFIPEPLTTVGLGFSLCRSEGQLGLFRRNDGQEESEEVAFANVEAVAEFIRRAYLAGDSGPAGDDDRPLDLPPPPDDFPPDLVRWIGESLSPVAARPHPPQSLDDRRSPPRVRFHIPPPVNSQTVSRGLIAICDHIGHTVDDMRKDPRQRHRVELPSVVRFVCSLVPYPDLGSVQSLREVILSYYHVHWMSCGGGVDRFGDLQKIPHGLSSLQSHRRVGFSVADLLLAALSDPKAILFSANAPAAARILTFAAASYLNRSGDSSLQDRSSLHTSAASENPWPRAMAWLQQEMPVHLSDAFLDDVVSKIRGFGKPH